MTEQHDPLDDVRDEDLDDFEDFDAYWEQRERARRPVTVTIRGIVVEAPEDLPVELELRPEKWANAETFDEIREYLVILVGDVVDQLVEAGIGIRQLQLLLMWAQANGSGKRTTLAQADELLAKAEAAEAGKAPPNRAARRATGRPTRSGGASRRTGR